MAHSANLLMHPRGGADCDLGKSNQLPVVVASLPSQVQTRTAQPISRRLPVAVYGRLRLVWIAAAVAVVLVVLQAGAVFAAGRLQEFLPKVQPAELFRDADRFGAPQGDPPLIPAYKGDLLVGYAYLNSDFTNAVGYSGKPIHVLIGIDPKAVITGLKLVGHSEPIVLVGIPERRVIEAINSLIGKNIASVAAGS